MRSGFVPEASFSGDYKKNPYIFQPFGLNLFAWQVNGQRVPQTPFIIRNSASEKQYYQIFHQLFETLNITDRSTLVNETNFTVNSFLLAADLTREGVGGTDATLEPLESVTIGIQGTFGTALSESVTVINYLICPKRFEINKNREVIPIY